jgi:hypothetical protein
MGSTGIRPWDCNIRWLHDKSTHSSLSITLTYLYRMAFDTTGLCAFSYRYNSFYLQDVHPFAKQMAEVLVESGCRTNRTSAENFIRVFPAEQTKKTSKQYRSFAITLWQRERHIPNLIQRTCRTQCWIKQTQRQARSWVTEVFGSIW